MRTSGLQRGYQTLEKEADEWSEPSGRHPLSEKPDKPDITSPPPSHINGFTVQVMCRNRSRSEPNRTNSNPRKAPSSLAVPGFIRLEFRQNYAS
jgi:hypothetical protein